MAKKRRIKLLSYTGETIHRGVIIQYKDVYTKTIWHLLVCEPENKVETLGCLLINISGRYAGCVEYVLPEESCSSECSYGIRTNWLISNWDRLMYNPQYKCPIQSVWLIENGIGL
ncbi:Imm45 family immunity protein [Phocaeicola sartorii]|uniref:Imm45 family immunity protein n=1 Tax=Phocaeicola sartorii TaxID=671267 RepID=UPI0025583A1A|nr:Imm45 family immunity protein [Phocaeicola sartorii]